MAATFRLCNVPVCLLCYESAIPGNAVAHIVPRTRHPAYSSKTAVTKYHKAWTHELFFALPRNIVAD